MYATSVPAGSTCEFYFCYSQPYPDGVTCTSNSECKNGYCAGTASNGARGCGLDGGSNCKCVTKTTRIGGELCTGTFGEVCTTTSDGFCKDVPGQTMTVSACPLPSGAMCMTNSGGNILLAWCVSGVCTADMKCQ